MQVGSPPNDLTREGFYAHQSDFLERGAQRGPQFCDRGQVHRCRLLRLESNVAINEELAEKKVTPPPKLLGIILKDSVQIRQQVDPSREDKAIRAQESGCLPNRLPSFGRCQQMVERPQQEHHVATGSGHMRQIGG
ncbi:MAG TPA: hypothetical protein VF043_28370 [Ktedonobacteraceae bacterium]